MTIATIYDAEDLACMDDIDETGRTVSGTDLIMQDVFHRLTTDVLINDDDFGIDIRRKIASGGYTRDNIANIQPLIDAVIQRDEEISESTTIATLRDGDDPESWILDLHIEGVAASGPFSFDLEIPS